MDLQQALQQASELKTAQLKAKRPEWENAPRFLRATLRKEGKEAEAGISLEERVETARAKKSEGNASYSLGKTEEALSYYIEGIGKLRHFVHRQESEMIALIKHDEISNESEEVSANARVVLNSLFLNCATALLSLDRADEANKASDLALSLPGKEQNAKAYYKKSLALLSLRSPDEALLYLRRTKALAPSDPAIHRELQRARRLVSNHKRSEKYGYQRIFSSAKGIYSDDDHERIRAGDGTLEDPLASLSDDDVKEHLKDAGVDENDERVQEYLRQRVTAQAKPQAPSEIKPRRAGQEASGASEDEQEKTGSSHGFLGQSAMKLAIVVALAALTTGGMMSLFRSWFGQPSGNL